MALQGSLEDIGIVELLQLPYRTRKTGRLTIRDRAEEFQLFYRNGRLLHASCAESEGFEAVVRLVSLEQAVFEFTSGTETEQRSIRQEFPQLVIQALQTSDERRFEEEERIAKQRRERLDDPAVSVGPENVPGKAAGEIVELLIELTERLRTRLDSNEAIEHIAVLSPGKRLRGEAIRHSSDAERFRRIRLSLHTMLSVCSPLPPEQVILQDERSVSVLIPLIANDYLLVIESGEKKPGIVTLQVRKLAAELRADPVVIKELPEQGDTPEGHIVHLPNENGGTFLNAGSGRSPHDVSFDS